MPVRILGINGSPRNGATGFALETSLAAAAELGDVETELVDLRKLELNFCIHCNRCLGEDILHCPTYKDGMHELYEKIRGADGLLLGTPVYQMSPSAQMVTFVNRLRPLGKLTSRGEVGLKVCGGIAVGGVRNGGQDTTLETLNNMMLATGLVVVSGGVYAYNGGSIWSNGEKRQGAEDDAVGLETVKVIGRRVAVVAGILKTGIEAAPMEGHRIAGFISHEEVERRRNSFRKG